MYRSLSNAEHLGFKIATELSKNPQFAFGKSLIARVANEVLIENYFRGVDESEDAMPFYEESTRKSPFDEANNREEDPFGRGTESYEDMIDNAPFLWAIDRLKTLATTGDHYSQVQACEMIVRVNILMNANDESL